MLSIMKNPLNGHGAIVNRLLQWGAIAGVLVYAMNVGQWVGAADEKFKNAEAVAEKQDTMVERVATLSAQQTATQRAVESNTSAIKESERKILEAIREAHRDD